MAALRERNWAGNHSYAGAIVRPTSIDKLRTVLAGNGRVRALSTRHSFNACADADVILDLTALPTEARIDPSASAVTVRGAVTYGMLIPELAAYDLAVHNLASLPHISVAGAVSTGTHGSGDANGNLATAVSAVELMVADGDIVTVRRGDEGFDGAVVGLGALGVVVGCTLDLQPSWSMHQQVYEDLDADEWAVEFDRITTLGDSLSAFTRWGDTIEQLWVKSDAARPLPTDVLGRPASVVDRHPIRELPAEACTEQCGIVGSWADRLPHFKLGFTPSAGDEVQSEFFVDRRHLPAAAAALRSAEPQFRDVLLISEVRTVAADDLWMSPHEGRDSAAFHFTWALDQPAAEAAAAVVADALAPFGVRAHWGKVAPFDASTLAEYDRAGDFLALAERLDPAGRFRNDWFDSIFRS